MPEVDKSALLKVPASDVFALLVQVERNPEWVPRMVSSERLTSGPTALRPYGRGYPLPLCPRPRVHGDSD